MYVEQPPDFENYISQNHIFKLTKSLYRLKQDPRVYYKRLNDFLIKKYITREKIDTTLFIKYEKECIILILNLYR